MALPYKLYILIPIFAVCVGTMLCMIGLATPWWYTVDNQNIYKHSGLWKECVTVGGTTQCSNPSDSRSWLDAVRAMTIISVLLIFATLTFGVLSITESSAIFLIATAISALAQAGAMAIGLAIYGGKTHHLAGSLSWSFGIGWAGVGLYLSGVFTAIVLAVNWRHVNYAPIN